VKLTDFGLCKESVEDGGVTHTFCGTIEYMWVPNVQDYINWIKLNSDCVFKGTWDSYPQRTWESCRLVVTWSVDVWYANWSGKYVYDILEFLLCDSWCIELSHHFNLGLNVDGFQSCITLFCSWPLKMIINCLILIMILFRVSSLPSLLRIERKRSKKFWKANWICHLILLRTRVIWYVSFWRDKSPFV